MAVRNKPTLRAVTVTGSIWQERSDLQDTAAATTVAAAAAVAAANAMTSTATTTTNTNVCLITILYC